MMGWMVSPSNQSDLRTPRLASRERLDWRGRANPRIGKPAGSMLIGVTQRFDCVTKSLNQNSAAVFLAM